MNSYTLLLLFLLTRLLFACSARFPAQHDGTIKDKDENLYTTRTMADGREWMTENLKINIGGSYCYDGQDINCAKYGRLYIWESANAACEMLGKGWHLPTNDEWERMAKHYGGIRTDAGEDGKEAYSRLIAGGDSEFNILFGGTRDPSGDYRRAEAHGFFWTATAYDSAHAWFYNLGKGGQFVNRHNDGEKSRAISVRCIKE